MTRRVTILEVMICLATLAIVAALSLPRLAEFRRHALELEAVTKLKAVTLAQNIFYATDKDADGQADYASLSELAASGLLTFEIEVSSRQGDRFDLVLGPRKAFALENSTAPAAPR